MNGVGVDALIERDGAACVWCGAERWRRDLTAEHLLPRSRGGRGRPENLAVACRRCNRRRRTRPVVAFVRELRESGVPVSAEPLLAALRRLGESASAPHAEYGRRQLALLDRLTAEARV